MLGDGRADDPLAELQREVADDLFRIPDRIRDPQLLGPLVEQVDRKHRERGQSSDEQRNLLEQVLEIEYGGDFTSKLGEDGQPFGIGGRACGGALRRGFGHCCVAVFFSGLLSV